MVKKVLSIALLVTILVTSCNESTKNENSNEQVATEVTSKPVDEIVNSTLTDKEGKKLEMSFNNTKDIVTVKFNGETIELVGQKPASGIWYKNDHYELRGKGEQVELTQDGKTIFKN